MKGEAVGRSIESISPSLDFESQFLCNPDPGTERVEWDGIVCQDDSKKLLLRSSSAYVSSTFKFKEYTLS